MASSSVQPQAPAGRSQFLPALALLVVIISLFFFRSYLPGWTLFSNDGPLGTLMAQPHRLPDGFTGGWQDLNNVGFRDQDYFALFYRPPLGAPQVSSGSGNRQGIGLLVWCFERRRRRRVVHLIPVTRRPNKALAKSRNSLVSSWGGRDI